MKSKILLVATLLLGIIFTVPNAAQAADVPVFTPPEIYEYGSPVTIHIDGQYLPCDVDPIIQNGRVLLPMRAAGEALGASVSWNGNTRCVTVAKDDNLIYFFVDSTNYYINGEPYTTDVAPTIIQDRTLLPLRAFAEALGTRVDWDQYLLDVSISTTGEKAELPAPPIDTTNDVYRYVQKYYTPYSDGNSILGSWMYHSTESGIETETYEFFYDTNQGIQNIEIIARYYPYYDFPTIDIYKSDTKLDGYRYLRHNYQNIIYLKDMGHGYVGHTDAEFQMLSGNLTQTGLLWYAMETDAFESYQAIGPLTFSRF